MRKLGKKKERIMQAIYYTRRTLDEVQINNATTEKELLVMVFAIDKFLSYFVDSKIIIYTNHTLLNMNLSVHLSLSVENKNERERRIAK